MTALSIFKKAMMAMILIGLSANIAKAESLIDRLKGRSLTINNAKFLFMEFDDHNNVAIYSDRSEFEKCKIFTIKQLDDNKFIATNNNPTIFETHQETSVFEVISIKKQIVTIKQFSNNLGTTNDIVYECLLGDSQNIINTMKISDNIFQRRKLLWSDFRGKPETKSKFDAAIYCDIRYNVYYSKKLNFFRVYPYVVISKHSYARTRSSHILEHEQLHYDICWIYARQFYARVKFENKIKFNHSKTKEIFDEICRELKLLNQKYEIETDHGNNQIKQKLWRDTIDTYIKNSDKIIQNLVGPTA